MSAIETLWKEASALKKALFVAVPAALIALLIGGVVFATAGGGASEEQVAAPTSTPEPSHTPGPPTPTLLEVKAYIDAIAPTATPERATYGGAAPRNPTSGAPPSGQYVARAGGTGPGPITGTDMSLSIPAIGVNASVYARTVGTNGQMGNPAGAWDVIWYDFSQNFPGLGGYPGTGSSNAVFAGHVDYIRVGPAVFWSVRNLAAGDLIHVTSANGTITYVVQWSAWAGPTEDFTGYVAQTGGDIVTLVTCIGGFSGGHYSNRLIVRGVRQ